MSAPRSQRAAARALALAALLLGTALVSGCGSSGAAGTKGTSGISVVTSTNVYADVVGQIADNTVSIRSIIADPGQDPHSYEANTRDQLALSRADIVVENGGGYDPFVATMLRSAGSRRADLLNAVQISGRRAPLGGELNEHVWYDVAAMQKLTRRLVAALSQADPADRPTFVSNAATFARGLAGLEHREALIRAAHAGTSVAITEPVPLYLLEACGLVNKTPEAFSAAIEEGTDVSPLVLKQTLNLFTSKVVRVLVYNAQTSGPETDRMLAAAKSNAVPVVPVTETLPAGKSYLTWMTANLDALQSAL